jgi:hypothetical protein
VCLKYIIVSTEDSAFSSLPDPCETLKIFGPKLIVIIMGHEYKRGRV